MDCTTITCRALLPILMHMQLLSLVLMPLLPRLRGIPWVRDRGILAAKIPVSSVRVHGLLLRMPTPELHQLLFIVIVAMLPRLRGETLTGGRDTLATGAL